MNCSSNRYTLTIDPSLHGYRSIRWLRHAAVVPEFALPPLHDSASKSSLDAQHRFLWATRAQLASLVVASFGGVVTLKDGDVEIGAVIALAGFAAALAIRGFLLAAQPTRAWY